MLNSGLTPAARPTNPMPPLAELNRKPPGVTADGHFGPWFTRIAEHLLNRVDFLVDGRAYRFAELEAYDFGESHPDPFAHRDPLQLQNGRWYFHRTGGTYRGGSFKGVDLTLGDGAAAFGMLVRTIVGPDGTVIDGPSRTVDHLLSVTKAVNVAALDSSIAARPAWDTTAPLAIREAPTARTAPVYATARVGLSLKRYREGRPEMPRFVMRPYRFLTEPRAIGKGRVQLVCALHQQGHDPAAIHRLTGVPVKTIERYVAGFTTGKRAASFEAYYGTELSTAHLCRLLGTWTARFGGPT